MTRDTVAVETPARRATSFALERRRLRRSEGASAMVDANR
jgi:hypothetical protein